jgi:hypothetical protein
MGLWSTLKNVQNLEKLYLDDLKKRRDRDSIIAQGITEDLVKEMIRDCETGLSLEIAYPNGTIFRVTRTLTGSLTETSSNGVGLSFKDSF